MHNAFCLQKTNINERASGMQDNWPLICCRSIFVLATVIRRWMLFVDVLSGMKSTHRSVHVGVPTRDGTSHRLRTVRVDTTHHRHHYHHHYHHVRLL